VPLTAPLVEVLQRRRFGADDRYVFSNQEHTCIAARAKKAASRLSKGLSFEFRAHDLRRTAASFMGEAGVDRFHIAHVLNHRSVTHSTVTAIYDRYRYDREKREALEIWTRTLTGILEARIDASNDPAEFFRIELPPSLRENTAGNRSQRIRGE
jgi:integrase